MAASKPLLLLDNASMLTLLHQGCFRLQEISFEEVKPSLKCTAAVRSSGAFPTPRSNSCCTSIWTLPSATSITHPWRTWRWTRTPLRSALCHAVGDVAQYPHGVRQ